MAPPRRPWLRVLLLLVCFVAGAGAGTAVGGWTLICRGGACPAVDVLEQYTPRQTSKLYAADGRFVAELGIERRTVVPLTELPQVIVDAFVMTEDKRFYEHRGVDWVRVFGAGAVNIVRGGYAQGFSTITMQLARNVFPERLTREKSIIRKLREVKVALAIERAYPKDRILELYLNQIYLGNGAHGVETAAQRYFGKRARDLSLAEAATLAALPKAPERYNPRRYPERAVQRRNTVIELMRRERVITDADAARARAYPLTLATAEQSGDVAAWFVEWVRRELDQHFGRELYERGLKVYTTLDVDLQSAAARALEQQLRSIESGAHGEYRHVSFETALAKGGSTDGDGAARSPYLQGAFVVIDPRSGAVRAMVGGRDFDDSKFNRATQALRQPGSTFKPIVYSAAIEAGRPTTTLLDDSPLTLAQDAGDDWTPQNYDLKFEGPVTMRRALTLSRNIPAIRLGMELGEDRVIEMARRFGLSSPMPPFPSLHIGSADVYPIEMIAAYTTFATLGTRSTPYAIVRVESADGTVLWEPAPLRETVMSPAQAWLVTSMLRDVVDRGTAAAAVRGGGFTLPAGGKTGTTNDGADVWFIGFTSDLVAGVWMGFDRPTKIKSNAQGGQLAAPAWTAFMKEAYQQRPAPPDWPRPAGLVAREIDKYTGQLRSPICPPQNVILDWFLPGSEPTQSCDRVVVPPVDTTRRRRGAR
ncbi:MAG: PBP1A family penicillin-binding protein [Gemmatimonadaceae bacterium]|nr:PBP1A family penicillin-binding protein [Gemmatimonadaceae bacterium]